MLSDGQKRERQKLRSKEWRLKNRIKWNEYQNKYKKTHRFVDTEKLLKKIERTEDHIKNGEEYLKELREKLNNLKEIEKQYFS